MSDFYDPFAQIHEHTISDNLKAIGCRHEPSPHYAYRRVLVGDQLLDDMTCWEANDFCRRAQSAA